MKKKINNKMNDCYFSLFYTFFILRHLEINPQIYTIIPNLYNYRNKLLLC